MGAAHSTFSASAADRWMQCPGSIVLSADAPRTASQYAAEGTVAHLVLTAALNQNTPAAEFIGMVFEADGFTFTVEEDMARHVQVCIDYVNDLKGADGILLVDQRVNYAKYLGVPEDQAWGTADVIVLRGDEVIVVDFKYGMGVEVSAERNRQMSLYALGALDMLESTMGEKPGRVRLAISQPRISVKPSEYDLSTADLEAWGLGEARSAACSVVNAQSEPPINEGQAEDWNGLYLRPGEKQCRFCPAKATCPALRAEVANTVFNGTPADPDEFTADFGGMTPKQQIALHSGDANTSGVRLDDEDGRKWLSACLSKVDLIEDWCKAVRAEVERRLLAGEPIPGFKLVQGKQGNRAWSDAALAEKMLREQFRLPIEEAYDLKLISPTTAEKLHKAGKIGPRQWSKAEALITRTAGKPHVAPTSDPRPALDIKPAADDFQPVTEDLA